jgi:hypothetical protein
MKTIAIIGAPPTAKFGNKAVRATGNRATRVPVNPRN